MRVLLALLITSNGLGLISTGLAKVGRYPANRSKSVANSNNNPETTTLQKPQVNFKRLKKHRHPIFYSILKLRPTISKETAYKYSNIFAKMAKKYQLDAFLLVALAMQEGSLVLETVSKQKAFVKIDEQLQIAEVSEDLCMMQIHVQNVEKMQLDTEKLLNDPHYCIEAGAKILAGFKPFSRRETYWWTRYNASTGYKRDIYRGLVMKHLNRILPIKHYARKSRRSIAAE